MASNAFIGVSEGNQKKVATYSFTEDTNTVNIERVAVGYGVLTLPGTAQVAAVTSTGILPAASGIDCTSRGRIVSKVTYSDSSTYCVIRLVFYDTASTVIGVSDELTIGNTAIADGARYIGDMILAGNDCGASSIKYRIVTIVGSGNVSIFCGTI